MPVGALSLSWLQNGQFPLYGADVLAASLRALSFNSSISMGGLQYALFSVSCLFLDCRSLSLLRDGGIQKPPSGSRDWKSAALKIDGIYICMQTEFLT